MTQTRTSSDLAQTTFQLLAIGILVASSFWIVRPFLIALIWATTIVISTWPVMLSAQRALGPRSAAVAVMTTALLMVLVVPLFVSIGALVRNADEIASWPEALRTFHIPQPPAWAASLPMVGTTLVDRWNQLAGRPPEELTNMLLPYARTFVLDLVRRVGSVGLLFIQFLLTVVLSAVLYSKGEIVAAGVERLARRLGGVRGAEAVRLSAQAIRGVALGVVGTAILQTTLTGLGLMVVGVPYAVMLTAVVFVFCIAQIGPALVLIPVVYWAYSQSGPVWGTSFLVWAIFCAALDNVVRPILIRRGADLPLLLIFSGVIGGLLAFGVIGLFIGPVVLAVAYTLLVEWVSEGEQQARP